MRSIVTGGAGSGLEPCGHSRNSHLRCSNDVPDGAPAPALQPASSAAIPSVPRSVKDPLASNEANVTGTLDVLVAAKDCGVSAASSSAYGDTPPDPER